MKIGEPPARSQLRTRVNYVANNGLDMQLENALEAQMPELARPIDGLYLMLRAALTDGYGDPVCRALGDPFAYWR